MNMEELKAVIRSLAESRQRELYLWMGNNTVDPRSVAPTAKELEVLIAVRAMELNNEVATMAALQRRLKISRDALTKRIERLNDTLYGHYLLSPKSRSRMNSYSTAYDKMIRQPATAMMALVFGSGRGRTASTLSDLALYGAARDIYEVEFYREYLTDLHYFRSRGGDSFGPGPRLKIEEPYILWLAGLWPVQSKNDMGKVVRFKNDILRLVWQQESGAASSIPLTQGALAKACLGGEEDDRAAALAEHAVGSLVTDGSLKLRFDPRTDSEVYFINEREDPGHSVVTWPETAFLLNALHENLIHPPEHRVTIEQWVGYALQGGVSLATTMEAIRFCEVAGYIRVHRDAESRIWRTERLEEQSSYIRFLAETYMAERRHLLRS